MQKDRSPADAYEHHKSGAKSRDEIDKSGTIRIVNAVVPTPKIAPPRG
jgi:hypothetical protein